MSKGSTGAAAGGGALYGLGIFGALFYYWQQADSMVHEAVRRGELPADDALDRLERIWRMRIRFLGDGVLRRKAWEVAERMGWSDTYNAEYVALTQLQAFVTRDTRLARSVKGIVATASNRRAALANAATDTEQSSCAVATR